MAEGAEPDDRPEEETHGDGARDCARSHRLEGRGHRACGGGSAHPSPIGSAGAPLKAGPARTASARIRARRSAPERRDGVAKLLGLVRLEVCGRDPDAGGVSNR